jgi:hypothetical protein
MGHVMWLYFILQELIAEAAFAFVIGQKQETSSAASIRYSLSPFL